MPWSKHWILHIPKSFVCSGQLDFCHSWCFFLGIDVWQQFSEKQHRHFQLHGILPVPVQLTAHSSEPWRLGQIPSQLHQGAKTTCWHHSYLWLHLSRASSRILTLSWRADAPGRWHLLWEKKWCPRQQCVCSASRVVDDNMLSLHINVLELVKCILPNIHSLDNK